MEILIAGMSDESKSLFQNESGEYLDIEEWEGIEFDGSGNITKISWADLEADGSVDLQWVPPTVKSVDLFETGLDFTNLSNMPDSVLMFEADECCLSGPIDFKGTWTRIREVYLQGNFIEGTLALADLPASLVLLDMDSNSLSGTINLRHLHRKFENLTFVNNDLEGSIDLVGLPATFKELRGSRNRFNGTLNFDILPMGMKSLCLEDNAFTGTIDLRQIPISIEEISLGCNKFSGTALVGKLSEALQYMRIGNPHIVHVVYDNPSDKNDKRLLS